MKLEEAKLILENNGFSLESKYKYDADLFDTLYDTVRDFLAKFNVQWEPDEYRDSYREYPSGRVKFSTVARGVGFLDITVDEDGDIVGGMVNFQLADSREELERLVDDAVSAGGIEALEEFRNNVTNGAINRFEHAQYDEFEEEPWIEVQSIKNIELGEFLKVVMEAVGARTQQELLDMADDEEKFNKMVEAWFQYLLNEKDDCMGWNYTWG